MVLEALMGGTVDEIIDDYLLSFNSIFESSIFNTTQKADSLVVMQLLSVMSNSLVINDQNLQSITENYLLHKIKLSVEEIALLKIKLSNATEIIGTKN
jgi:hypothetical protein